MEPLIDDPEISNEEILYRRIAPQWMIYENNQWRPSSGAFKTDQMSVHLSSLISPEKTLAAYPEHSLVSITARKVRELECIIARKKNDLDPSHALVCPQKNFNAPIPGGTAKRLAKSAIWVKINPPLNV